MTTGAAPPKLDALTSLRFFAAAMIVALHGTPYGIGPAWLTQFALSQGVSFFFVLSGFVLAYNYPALERPADIGRFLVARIARVWPLHVVTALLMVTFMAHVSYGALPADSRDRITLAFLTLTQSWVPRSEYILAYNGVAWSISNEWFFYLAFPFLIAGTPRSRWAKLAFAFALMGAMWTLATLAAGAPGDGRSNFAYFSPLARLFEFVLGIVACDFYRRHGALLRERLTHAAATRLELGVVMLAVAALWLSRWAFLELAQGDAVAKTASVVVGNAGPGAFVWAALIFVFALGAGALARGLGARGFVFLGEISFALYLVHMHFLMWGKQSLGLFAHVPAPLHAALYWGCSIALATLLYYAIEKPWRTIIRRSVEGGRIAPLLPRAGAVAATLAAATATAAIFQPSPRGEPPQRLPHDAKALLRNPVEFDAGFRLEQAALVGASDRPELLLTWTATRDVPLDRRVGVHLLDRQGRMVAQKDYSMDVRFRRAAQGERWSYTVPVADRAFAYADSFGIAVYGGPSTARVTDAGAVSTDWDRHRVLVAMDGSGAPRFAAAAARPVAVAAVRASPRPPERSMPPRPMPPDAKVLVRRPVEFDAGLRLEDATLMQAGTSADRASTLRFTWSATRAAPLDRKIAVHLLDRHGRILAQVDFAMDVESARVVRGERWSYDVPMPAARRSLEGVDAFGIVIYGGAGEVRVAPRESAATDWNRQRLLVAADSSGASGYAQSLAANEARNLLRRPVEFDAGYRLEEAALLRAPPGGESTLRFTWTATRAVVLDRKVGVHLLDGAERIIAQMDYAMDNASRKAAKGERWSHTAHVPEGFRSLEQVEEFGIVIYGGGGESRVAHPERVTTDWNGQRLLVAVDAARDRAHRIESVALPKAAARVPAR